MYKVKMDQNRPELEELTKEDQVKLSNKKRKKVKFTLTLAELEQMRKIAQIKTAGSEHILRAFITKTLNDAKI